MNLRDKYTLGEIVSEGEVKTYAARELGSDASVLVHCLGTAKVDLMTLVVRHLRAAPLGVSSGVLEMFESGGEVYLVTEALPGFSNLRAWLDSDALSSPRPRTGSVPLQQEPPRSEPLAEKSCGRESDQLHVARNAQTGEFTQLFQPSRGDEIVGEFSAPHLPANDSEENSRKAGEFTQLFQPSFGDSFVDSEDLPIGIERLAERGKAGEITRILQPTVNRGPQESLPISSLRFEQEASVPAPEPGFGTLFGQGAGESQPADARDSSGTAILSAPSSTSAKTPEVSQLVPQPGRPPSPERGVRPERPAPPAQASSEAVVQPPPAPKPPQQPSLPKAFFRPPPPPSVPRVLVPPAPSLAKPPMLNPPQLPVALKAPSTPKLPTLAQGAVGEKPGPSTIELLLILGGLLLVVVAAVLLIKSP